VDDVRTGAGKRTRRTERLSVGIVGGREREEVERGQLARERLRGRDADRGAGTDVEGVITLAGDRRSHHVGECERARAALAGFSERTQRIGGLAVIGRESWRDGV